MKIHLVLIEEPHADLCALPAADRLCFATACPDSLMGQLPLVSRYHFTRCRRDGVPDEAPGFRPIDGERHDDCTRYDACMAVHREAFGKVKKEVPGSCVPNCAWFVRR